MMNKCVNIQPILMPSYLKITIRSFYEGDKINYLPIEWETIYIMPNVINRGICRPIWEFGGPMSELNMNHKKINN